MHGLVASLGVYYYKNVELYLKEKKEKFEKQ